MNEPPHKRANDEGADVSIADWFRPKWRHSDRSVREEAVRGLTDPSVLAEVAKNDPSPDVRKVAVALVTDPSVLAGVAKNDASPDVRWAAVGRLTDQAVLADIAEHDRDGSVRAAAVRLLTDQSVLVRIARTDRDSPVSDAAIARVTDQAVILDIAKNHGESSRRATAVRRVTDHALIADIARTDLDWIVRWAAVEGVTDQDILVDIAKKDPYSVVRGAALKRVTNQVVLADFAKNDRDVDLALALVERVTDQPALADIARHANAYRTQAAAVGRITDENVAADIAKAHCETTGEAAVARVTTPELLADIAKSATRWAGVALERLVGLSPPLSGVLALGRIGAPRSPARLGWLDDPVPQLAQETDAIRQATRIAPLVASVAKSAKDAYVRAEAVRRLGDPERLATYLETLANIAGNDSSPKVRAAAAETLDVTAYAELLKMLHTNVAALETEADPSRIEQLARFALSRDTRVAAIKRVTDEAVLLQIAKNGDEDSNVQVLALGCVDDPDRLADLARTAASYVARKAAVVRVTDQAVLEEIATQRDVGIGNIDVREAATNRLTDQRVLAEIAKNDRFSDVRRAAVARLTGERMLAGVAKMAECTKNDGTRDVSKAALERVTDQGLLVEIARTAPIAEVRRAAVARVTDEVVAADITKNDVDAGVCESAVARVKDQGLLADIARSAPELHIRWRAAERLTDTSVSDALWARVILEHLGNGGRMLNYDTGQRVVEIARRKPELFRENWDVLASSIKHEDYGVHEDCPAACNFSHGDRGHTDKGPRGLALPPKPTDF
jgi:hypothetical protein